jgi:hypothetical protein
MISFALARELKNAGLTQRNNSNSVYFINDHLKIRREKTRFACGTETNRQSVWTSIYQKKSYIRRP